MLDSIDKTGDSDVAETIQAALNACGPEQVVALPPGTFKIGRTLTIPGHVVLRGSGPGTVLLSNLPSADVIKFYGPYWYYATPIAVVSGAAKGSTSVEVATTKELAVGVKVQLQAENDPQLIFGGSEGSGGPWARGQWLEVTGISGNTVTFTPALYQTYDASLKPRLRFPVNGANPARNFTEYAGVENLTIKNNHPYGNANISMQFTAYSWVKGVTSLDAGLCHIWTFDTFRCEIRDSTFRGVLPPITSSRGYGIQLGTPGGDQPNSKTTALLIENNIFEGNRGHVTVGYGAAGCVIGYNFFTNAASETANIQKMDIAFHSSYPMMNLIEGNVGIRGIVADTFHGNSGDNTIYRNWWKGKAAGKDSALCSIELDAYQRNFTAVGNILGYPEIASDLAALSNPKGVGVYEKLAPDAAPYGNFYKVWMLGYAGEGGGTSPADPQVAATLLRHGNYDYVTKQTHWDDTISDHTLPASLYLSAKPKWWAKGAPFPPIGPDVTPMTNSIPAQMKFEGVLPSGPVPPGNLQVTPK